jgi:hypothetical protein
MQIIPHCEMRQVGNTIICDYTIERWKLVLKADVELVHLRSKLKKILARSAELSKQVEILQGQIDVHGETRKILVEREAKLTKDLIDLDRKYQLERVKPRWGNPVAWGVAAVSVALLGGYIVNDVLD